MTIERTFWDLMRASGSVFESTLHGVSMEPTIPDGARIQISPKPAGGFAVGQVAACVLKDEALFAHRIVHRGAGGVVLTRGDHRVLCDPPTREDQILGVVTALWQEGAWRAPGTEPDRGAAIRSVSAAHRLLLRMCLPLHFELARRVAGTTLIAGSLFKRMRSALAGK
jgi:hypothetical protein